MSIATALRDPSTGTVTVPAHEFAAGLLLWAEGTINEAKAKSLARLPAHADADWNAMKAAYQGKGTAVAQLVYVLKVEAASLLYQNDDTITEAELNIALEIT